MSGTVSLGIGSAWVQQDCGNRLPKFLGEVRTGHCAEKKYGEMGVAAGCADHAKHLFPELGSHQTRRWMAAPILGREVGVSLRQRRQGGEQRSGLHEADGFRIPVTQDRVGVGSDTSNRESLVEVRHPRMESPERRRHAAARAEQTEDPPFGAALSEATREPFCAEILGEDSVNRRKSAFTLGLEQSCPERIVGELGERQRADIGNVYTVVRGVAVRACKDAATGAEDLRGTHRPGREQQLFIAPVNVGVIEMTRVLLSEHYATGVFE